MILFHGLKNKCDEDNVVIANWPGSTSLINTPANTQSGKLHLQLWGSKLSPLTEAVVLWNRMTLTPSCTHGCLLCMHRYSFRVLQVPLCSLDCQEAEPNGGWANVIGHFDGHFRLLC